MKTSRHILSLSGGKDSAALAVYMAGKIPNMEYIFHDSGKELPETYSYLARLESELRITVTRTSPPGTFDHWLTVYGGIIPSNHRRWCTRMLKLKPFEDYVGDDPVFNYVAIRADEEREGYVSTKPNIIPIYPFRDDGITYQDVVRILTESKLGFPTYTDWGRTRSGCFFCFYQQKIEWVRLKETHPNLYEEAKAYESPNKINGNVFYWNGDESLEDLEKPERVAAIKKNWEAAQKRLKANAPNQSLVSVLAGYEDEESTKRGCAICHL
jgi:3'-phosphoadenosine 5'-phosphosulfate sulfotransferase (PAPS reductase)/FAD synthetase